MEFYNQHYPVEYLIFYCKNTEEAKKYLDTNDIWTEALAQYPGFVSSTSYINLDNPGEVRIVIIWETLEQWLAIPKENLMKIAKEFDEKFGLEYKNGPRLHNENNFGYHKVLHYER